MHMIRLTIELYQFDLPFRLLVYMIVLMMFRKTMSITRRDATICILLYFAYVAMKLRFLF